MKPTFLMKMFWMKLKVLVINEGKTIMIDINTFSSLDKLYRITAWLKWYVRNLLNKVENKELKLTSF